MAESETKSKRHHANNIGRHFRWRKPLSMILKYVWWQPRAKRVAKHIVPYIPEQARVLDIGAGNGLIASELISKKHANVILLDVIDWNISGLPLKMFDGARIPYADKEFDVALLVDVVHHAEDEARLVREAVRVANKVVVLEEVHTHAHGTFLANITDNLQYILYGMPLGHHHRSDKEWEEFFKRFSKDVQNRGTYYNHIIFTL